MGLRSSIRNFYSSEEMAERFAGLAAKLYRKSASPKQGAGSAVAILFPTDRGSMGDEAMLQAVFHELRQAGCSRIGLISFAARDRWDDIRTGNEVTVRPIGWPLRWLSFAKWLGEYDAVGVIGADVIDGYYSPVRSKTRLRIAKLAAGMGLRSVVLGFSYRTTPEPSSLAYLTGVGEGVTICNRDPRSRERVAAMTGKNPVQTADLAFLLPAKLDTPAVQQAASWIAAQRAAGRTTVLGLNCNVQALGKGREGDAGKLAASYAEAIVRVAGTAEGSKVAFVLVPHDNRGELSDEKMGVRIYEQLPEALRTSQVLLIREISSAAEIKGIASLLDVAITGRMHFAIACLGSGTPALSFEYQDKFTGLYQLFSLTELCVPGETSLDAAAVAEAMQRLIATCPELRRKVAENLPAVRALSLRNVQALLGQQASS